VSCDGIRYRSKGNPVPYRSQGEPVRYRSKGNPVKMVTCEPSTIDASLTYLSLDGILTLDGWLYLT
jgi:hypothetical protein